MGFSKSYRPGEKGQRSQTTASNKHATTATVGRYHAWTNAAIGLNHILIARQFPAPSVPRQISLYIRPLLGVSRPRRGFSECIYVHRRHSTTRYQCSITSAISSRPEYITSRAVLYVAPAMRKSCACFALVLGRPTNILKRSSDSYSHSNGWSGQEYMDDHSTDTVGTRKIRSEI